MTFCMGEMGPELLNAALDDLPATTISLTPPEDDQETP